MNFLVILSIFLTVVYSLSAQKTDADLYENSIRRLKVVIETHRKKIRLTTKNLNSYVEKLHHDYALLEERLEEKCTASESPQPTTGTVTSSTSAAATTTTTSTSATTTVSVDNRTRGEKVCAEYEDQGYPCPEGTVCVAADRLVSDPFCISALSKRESEDPTSCYSTQFVAQCQLEEGYEFTSERLSNVCEGSIDPQVALSLGNGESHTTGAHQIWHIDDWTKTADGIGYKFLGRLSQGYHPRLVRYKVNQPIKMFVKFGVTLVSEILLEVNGNIAKIDDWPVDKYMYLMFTKADNTQLQVGDIEQLGIENCDKEEIARRHREVELCMACNKHRGPVDSRCLHYRPCGGDHVRMVCTQNTTRHQCPTNKLKSATFEKQLN